MVQEGDVSKQSEKLNDEERMLSQIGKKLLKLKKNQTIMGNQIKLLLCDRPKIAAMRRDLRQLTDVTPACLC